MTTARLFLSGIRASGRHGARPGEKDEAQDFVVDLDIEVNVGDDHIAGTADYRGITETVRAIIEQRSFDLIESMAGAIADEILGARSRRARHGRRAQAERRRPSGHRRRRRGRHRPPPVARRWRPTWVSARTWATGSPRSNAAVDLLAADPGIAVRRTSRVWETDPVGGPEQPDFLNIVAEIDTDLEPLDLLAAVDRVESELGRVARRPLGPPDHRHRHPAHRRHDDRRRPPHRPPPPHARASVRPHAPPRARSTTPSSRTAPASSTSASPTKPPARSPLHSRCRHDRTPHVPPMRLARRDGRVDVPELRCAPVRAREEAASEGAGAEVRSHPEERSREAASTASVAPSAAPPRPSSPPPPSTTDEAAEPTTTRSKSLIATSSPSSSWPSPSAHGSTRTKRRRRRQRRGRRRRRPSLRRSPARSSTRSRTERVAHGSGGTTSRRRRRSPVHASGARSS